MRLAQDDEMVHTLAPDRSDQPFGKAIVPRRGRCRRLVPDAHGAQSACDDGTVDPIPIANGVLRGVIPREGLCYLACNPFCRLDHAAARDLDIEGKVYERINLTNVGGIVFSATAGMARSGLRRTPFASSRRAKVRRMTAASVRPGRSRLGDREPPPRPASAISWQRSRLERTCRTPGLFVAWGAIDLASAYPGRERLHVPDRIQLRGQEIVGHDHEVGELAGLDRAAHLVLAD